MKNNPYHNQHILEFSDCLENALSEQQQYYDAQFKQIQERIEFLEQKVEKLEHPAKGKAPQLEAEVTVSRRSMENVLTTIRDFFKH